MKTILICKGGSVFYTRKAQQGSANGENGETEGIIRELKRRDDFRLVYFGHYRGEPLCEVVEPHTQGLNHLSLSSEQKKGFAADISALKQYEPIVGFIHTAGYSPSFSMIDNPNGAQVQGAAIRYTAPMHNVLNHYKIPRCVINNDPRTYPKDQEMSMGWPYSRPAALLDQQDDSSWTKIVGGRRYRVEVVYGANESWAYYPPMDTTKHRDMCIVAHAHVHTGIRNSSFDLWRPLLENVSGVDVFGSGWKKIGDNNFHGPVKPYAALQIIASTRRMPVVAHTPGFRTGKPYVLSAYDCTPLPHKNYAPWGWETFEEFQELEGRPWIKNYDMLHELVDGILAEDLSGFGGYFER